MDTIYNLITSPFIQFFLLAFVAGLFKSDLNIPEQVTKALALYLMMAIGLKGGISLRESDVALGEIIGVMFAGVSLGFVMPAIGYFCLRKTTKLDRINAAAISAHYGSISVVTFSYAVSFITDHGLTYMGYVVTLMALMEAPAIMTGLMLAMRGKGVSDGEKAKPLFSMHIIKDAFFNGSIVLLLGSIIIGFTANEVSMQKIGGFFIEPFQAVLCVFLLDLGLITARQMSNLRVFSLPQILFGIYMPLIGFVLAMLLSLMLGLALAEAMLFCTLAASASYIAVPAAMKIALPQANPALYITSSLGITFPFNLLIGIPVYYEILKLVF